MGSRITFFEVGVPAGGRAGAAPAGLGRGESEGCSAAAAGRPAG